jgi:4-hydroxy-tetrahydrodipicolinate synthase
VISVIANAFPAVFSNMIRAALKGDLTKARQLHESLLNIHPLLYVEGNPAGVKAATSLLRLSTPEVRLPLTSLSREKTSQLHALIDLLLN